MSLAQVDRYENNSVNNGTSMVPNDLVNTSNIKLICKRNIDFENVNGVRKVLRIDNDNEQQQQQHNGSDRTQLEDWHPSNGTRYFDESRKMGGRPENILKQ